MGEVPGEGACPSASAGVLPTLGPDARTVVFLCPGQGAQTLGMGSSLKGSRHYREVFACASEAFGTDVARVAEEGPAEELNRTLIAQAATLALSITVARILEEEGIVPGAVLGFSLGQVAGLNIAGMLGLEETFDLAFARASAMQRAADENAGAMLALVGATAEEAAGLCSQCAQGDVLVPANYNCPGQVVLSGTSPAIARAQEAWAAGGKRAVVLATTGPFHSPLMAPAAEEFGRYLARVGFEEPAVPLVCNTDAALVSAATAAERLTRHLVQPVLFEAGVRVLAGNGAGCFVEVGHGGVLTGLVKRIDKGVARHKAEDAGSIQKLIAVWGSNHG